MTTNLPTVFVPKNRWGSYGSPYPSSKKARQLLAHLMSGVMVDTVFSMMEINLQTPNARVSELRRLGWPVRSIKVHHPRLEGEEWIVYTLDDHFRAWFADTQDHPRNYEPQDGRGKFARKARK